MSLAMVACDEKVIEPEVYKPVGTDCESIESIGSFSYATPYNDAIVYVSENRTLLILSPEVKDAPTRFNVMSMSHLSVDGVDSYAVDAVSCVSGKSVKIVIYELADGKFVHNMEYRIN